MRTLLVLAAVLAVTGCATTSSPAGGGPGAAPPGTVAPATTAAAATSAPPAGHATGDFCALSQRIGNESGLMVGTHYISPLKETLEQLKAATDAYLANSAALLAGVPDDIRPSLMIEGEYFQALKDHNFGADTPLPAGFDAALAKVNAYQVEHCGFVFDK